MLLNACMVKKMMMKIAFFVIPLLVEAACIGIERWARRKRYGRGYPRSLNEEN